MAEIKTLRERVADLEAEMQECRQLNRRLAEITDGEISEFTVDPDHTRNGHGSRLVQACADTLRADKFTRAVLWLNSADDVLRGFLAEAGWAPDGAHRELDLHGEGSVTVKQVRLHTDLSQNEV